MQKAEHNGLLLVLGVIALVLVTLLAFTGCTNAVRPNSSNYIGRKMKLVYLHGCMDSYSWYSALSEKARLEVINYCEGLTEEADEGKPACHQKK